MERSETQVGIRVLEDRFEGFEGLSHNNGNRAENASENEGEDAEKPCQQEAVKSRRKSRPDEYHVIARCFFSP